VNALEKVVDLLVAVILMFLVPLLYYGSGIGVSRAILTGQTGENFLKRVSTAGEITLPVWNEMEDALRQYGCERLEVQWERRVYEPIGEDGVVAERVYTEYKERVEERLYQTGRIRLQKGDRIKLTLYVNDMPTVYYCTVRTGATDF
jgi:hypothetical protein